MIDHFRELIFLELKKENYNDSKHIVLIVLIILSLSSSLQINDINIAIFKQKIK